jgi:hypothetical protein
MKSMKAVDLGRLKWKQKRFAVDDFELRSGKDLVGVMYWTKWLSDLAVAKSVDGRWHLDRPGFFRDRVIVSEQESEEEIAVFDIDWFGEGTLTFVGGRSYQWYRTKAFCNHWALANEDEEVLFEIREGTRWFKHEAVVVLYIAAEKEADLPLLILIGWYLVIMAIQDSAAVVAATTAAVM